MQPPTIKCILKGLEKLDLKSFLFCTEIYFLFYLFQLIFLVLGSTPSLEW